MTPGDDGGCVCLRAIRTTTAGAPVPDIRPEVAEAQGIAAPHGPLRPSTGAALLQDPLRHRRAVSDRAPLGAPKRAHGLAADAGKSSAPASTGWREFDLHGKGISQQTLAGSRERRSALSVDLLLAVMLSSAAEEPPKPDHCQPTADSKPVSPLRLRQRPLTPGMPRRACASSSASASFPTASRLRLPPAPTSASSRCGGGPAAREVRTQAPRGLRH